MKNTLITTLLVLVALVVLLIGVSFSFTDKALTTEKHKAEKKILLNLTIRKENIEMYYRSVQAEVLFWAKNKTVRQALKKSRRQANTAVQQLLNNLATEQGYDNILLATPQGKLVYSVNQNVTTLPINSKRLLKNIQQTTKTSVYFADYNTTTSSAHASVAAGIFNQQTLIGILIVQLSHQPLTKLLKPLTDNPHFSIQTLVIGSDKQLRHVVTTMPHKVPLPALADALLVHGNQHVFTIHDQNNIPFLAAFDFAHIAKNITWVIISKADATQATQHVKQQVYHWLLLGIALLISALVIGYVGERWMRSKQENSL